MPDDAFYDLTTDACARFNELTPNVPGVRTASVAGECARPYLGVEWQFSARIVQQFEGANDGVVSVASAAWGDTHDVWKADHLNLVNWPNRLMQLRRGVERPRCGLCAPDSPGQPLNPARPAPAPRRDSPAHVHPPHPRRRLPTLTLALSPAWFPATSRW